jgi:hypothetical protein
MKWYKATQKNRNGAGMNFLECIRTYQNTNSITLKFSERITKNDCETLEKIMYWLNDILAVRVEYNKTEQLTKILFEHFKSLGMSDDLANKLVDNLFKEERK